MPARGLVVLALLVVAQGCESESSDASQAPEANTPSAQFKAEIRAAPSQVANAAAVIKDAATAAGATESFLMVYIGAPWCEPCRYFHDAVVNGEVAFSQRIQFLEFDYDKHKPALDAAGYGTTMLPAFAVPNSEGACGPKRFSGGIKGPQAVGYLSERVEKLLQGVARKR